MSPLHQHPQVALLFDATCRAIFEKVARGAASAPELARNLELPTLQVRRALRRLSAAGLVVADRRSRIPRYRIDPAGMEAMNQALDGAWTRRLLGAFALGAGRSVA